MSIVLKRYKQQLSNSKSIDKQLHQDHISNYTHDLLLLDYGHSGKSTFIHYLRAQSHHSPIEYYNLVLRTLGKVAWSIISNNSNPECAAVFNEKIDYLMRRRFLRGDPDNVVIKQLLSHQEVRSALLTCRNGDNNHLHWPSTEYFLKEMDRILSLDYIPTDVDIAYIEQNRGISETIINVDRLGEKLRIIDPSKQKNVARKWLHQFNNVQGIIFMVSLSEYDQVLSEEEIGDIEQNTNHTTYRLKQSLVEFDKLVNSGWYDNIPLVLILNKVDLFQEKLTQTPLTICFPEYQGPNTKDDCINYIKSQYLNLNNTDKRIFILPTTSYDSNNLDFIRKYVLDHYHEKVLNSNKMIKN